MDQLIVRGAAGPKGYLPLKFGKLVVSVAGGPYVHRPEGFRGVKMAEEINAAYDISVPTRDFSVPKTHDMRLGLMGALMYLLEGEHLYVGCMGGIGRTGLFLGGLVKVMSEYRRMSKKAQVDPKSYVREHYLSHAIETKQQEDYLKNLPVRDIAEWVKVYQRMGR